VESKVDPAGDSPRGEDFPVIDPARVGTNVGAGSAQVLERNMVCDGRATLEDAGSREEHRAGTHARDDRAARMTLCDRSRYRAAQPPPGTISNSGLADSTPCGVIARPWLAVMVSAGSSVTSVGCTGASTSKGPIASSSSKP
jgi:hypothetical protein